MDNEMRKHDVSKYGLDLILPLSLILLAELLIFQGKMEAAMMVHAATLMLLILSSIYIENRIYPVLMLLPLFRLLNIAMPVFFHAAIYFYPLAYAPMFGPIYFLLKEGMLNRSEAGLTMKGLWFYLPLAMAVGFALGWGEHMVLRSGVLTPDSSIKSIIILSLTMILFVGVVEEFVFRSALQTVMEARLGSMLGLLVTSMIFGLMHSGYHLPQEILYVAFAGLVFGLLFRMTKSLPVISVAHGFTNVSLFLIAPAYSGVLIYLIGITGLMFLLTASLYKRMPRKPEPREN